MNSRAAKLQDFDLFEKSIVQNKKQLIALFDKTIFDLNKVELKDEIYFLFNSLDLVHIGKPPLVTFSKTMHFFLPKLISPIDRRYTLTYFYNNVNVPNTIEKQFAKFWAIQQKYLGIATEYNLSNFVDNKWNSTIPKVVDNIIIGICKIKEGLKTKTIEEI